MSQSQAEQYNPTDKTRFATFIYNRDSLNDELTLWQFGWTKNIDEVSFNSSLWDKRDYITEKLDKEPFHKNMGSENNRYAIWDLNLNDVDLNLKLSVKGLEIELDKDTDEENIEGAIQSLIDKLDINNSYTERLDIV